MHPLTFGLDEIRDYHARRLITVREQDNLIICNYSQKCTYSKSWDHITEQCRGLILRLDQPYQQATKIEEVVALPFKKFFNLGEDGRQPTAPLVEIAEKMDGYLGVFYRHNEECRISTRGAFDSEYAIWATSQLKPWHAKIPQDYTLMFEIIQPGKRIIVDYGERQELTLLGVRDRYTGDEPTIDLDYMADYWGFGRPKIYDDMSIYDLLRTRQELDYSQEGWVCKFADGSRFKIKVKEYVRIQKILESATKKEVITRMIDKTFEEWTNAIPEEFLTDVRIWQNEIEEDIKFVLLLTDIHFEQAPKDNRKIFASYVKSNCPKIFAQMFAKLDGYDLRKSILKGMLK